MTDQVKPAGKGGAEGAEVEEKSLPESELGKAKSPTNNVLAGAPAEKEKEDRVGEEVYSGRRYCRKTPISSGEITRKIRRLLYGDSGEAIPP